MVENNILIIYENVYAQIANANDGNFLPDQAADSMARYLNGENPEVVQTVLDIFNNPPSKGLLYEDTSRLFDWVLANNVVMNIWTQGDEAYQVAKIRNADFPEGIIRNAMKNVFVGLDKVEIMKELMKNRESDHNNLVIIDDKIENIMKVKKIAEELGVVGVEFILMDRDARFREEVDGVRKVCSFDEVIADFNPNSEFYVDLDYTLLDHRKVRDRIGEKLNAVLGPIMLKYVGNLLT